ncbi:MAG: hypothetical protein M0R77_00205 [Gammaproteobacteria bacterium]|nr:hypothetical protein [Acholeplasmataceae bacterium]MCK9528976.1 hypothetical protein [Gammaproteobacteria bacterium]
MSKIKASSQIRIVKIHASRGYGDGHWEVIEEVNSSTYKLRCVDTSEVIYIFKAHCFEDTGTRKLTLQKRREYTEGIGKR